MAEFQPPPLILYMENTTGEEVAVNIEPDDDFQKFLDKAKIKLGVDVDINCITKNKPVSLQDSIYQFLVNTEPSVQAELQNAQMFDPTTDFHNSHILPTIDPVKLAMNDQEYVLDDGTQIVASHIQFDNEDVILDITIEKLPFVKYKDDDTDNDIDLADAVTKKINIVESPVAKWSNENSPKKLSFINCLPFKPVCNNTSGFEAQFTKYLEATSKTYTTLNTVASKNKSPRSLIRDNYKKYDDVNRYDDLASFSREEILNMFKDSPVTPLPYDGNTFYDKRKNVRKSDPLRHHSRSKPVSYVEIDGVLIGGTECQDCFICRKYVDNSADKLYIFNNEDQKLYKSSSQNKNMLQHKIICEHCLEVGFKPIKIKNQNQPLTKDEYLVIKNNKQYTFQKLSLKEAAKRKMASHEKDLEYVKVEIGSDGEIVTKPIDNDLSDDVIVVKDERDSSDDVEIIEPDLDNLEEADEDVKAFLGKYQCDDVAWKELKCRFCERMFNDISEIIEHGDVHKHNMDDGDVFPCPLCDYGYANFKWLKGHLRAAHDKKDTPIIDVDKNKDVDYKENEPNSVFKTSPVARRTRSAFKKSDDTVKDKTEKSPERSKNEDSKEVSMKPTLMTEVKQEALDSSEEEIWILQTCDDDGEQLNKLFNTAKSVTNTKKKCSLLPKKTHKCFTCSRIFVSADALSTHRCIKRRGRKAKICYDKPIIPSTEDFIKRAQGRPRREPMNENDLLIPTNKRRRTGEPTSDPHIMTCNNCNESFTSKVRLKFHMQFHDSTTMMTKDGRYACNECERDSAIFATETELFDHVHFQHDKLKKWQCPVKKCGKTFYLRATLTKHSRAHLDARRYVCATCNKRFLDKQTRDEHGVTHLQIKPYQCHICMKQLTRRSRLRMHLRAHEEQLSPALVCVCRVCARAFVDHTKAQEHATKSLECIQAFANDLKVEATEEAVVHLSPTSGIVRQSVQNIDSPKLSKPILRQVSSPLSRPILSKLSVEARNITTVVEIEKAFRCEYCEDVFYTEDGLNTHRVKHKGVKNPFTCHICKVSFASYSRCTTHKTTHGFYKRSLTEAKKSASEGKTKDNEAGPSATGILGYGGFPVVKHFLCEDCGRSYLHWTYLQVHRRMKHADENVLYRCNHCDQTFLNSWSVAYHKKKTHGKAGEVDKGITKVVKEDHKIPCRDCEATLPNKTALYKHRRDQHMSSNEPKKGIEECVYQCGWCGARCPSTGQLQRHARTYHAQPLLLATKKCITKPETWSCDSCGRCYKSKQELRIHLREKHSVRTMVIEVQGDPTNSKIMELLALNHIPQNTAIEVTKFTFRKGTSSIIPNSIRAISKLSNIPRTQVYLKADAERNNAEQDRSVSNLRSGATLQQNLNMPSILSTEPQRPAYPISLNPHDLTERNVQMLLRDGVLVNGNQMVQLQLEDNMLLE